MKNIAVILLAFLVFPNLSFADSTLILEGGNIWQNRNDVHIPPNTSGTRFEIDEITGDGPDEFYRIEYIYRFQSPHAVRVLYAPLTLKLKGYPQNTIEFDGTSFAADTLTEFSYTFNSYRITYFYAMWGHNEDQFNIGFTAKQRDAEIKLSQGGTVATYDNTGFVPLLYLQLRGDMGKNWFYDLSMDGLAGGPGRAFDVAVKVKRSLGKNARAGLGYRTVEGGADNDKVYTFSWFNYALLDLEFRF